ncbi:MAG: restriction endonuclease subunit S [Longimicrobiaceae bacterium]
MTEEQSWLHSLPPGWEKKKLKYVAFLKSGEMITSDTIDASGEFPVYGGNGLRGYTSAYTHCGDYVLIGRQGALCGNINFVSGCFWASEHAIVAKPRVQGVKTWLGELLRSMELNQYSQSAAQPGLAVEVISNLDIPVPPASVQRKIAAFLDLETVRLDALVASKERVLRLLAEKRRALINHAVTRGVGPDVPMRDSRISWLGEIPTHWETRKLAWLFRERDERGEPELPLLEVSIREGVVLREFSADRIESTAANFNSYKVARAGDIVFNKMRMWQGAVGVAPVDGLVSPDYVVAVPKGTMSSQFAGLLFRTDAFSAECARHSRGIVWDRLRLYWDGFREIEVPLPALQDQVKIVEAVTAKTAALDRLRDSTFATISLLQERRAALIAAAVTGQLPIPGIADGLPSEEEMACSSTT